MLLSCKREEGGYGVRRVEERLCWEVSTYLKNLACQSVFLAAYDSLLGGGRSKIKSASSQPQS
jgi:hypothetical protein